MAPDLLLAAGLADAFDHGIMIERIGQDQAVRQKLRDRGDAGLVRDIAGREHQGGRLVVQVGELTLELDQRMVGAGDVARAARAGAHAGCGLDHGADHLRVLGHAEVVVRAPDHDVALALRGVPDRVRKTACDALEIGENPVAALVPQFAQGRREITLVIHVLLLPGPRAVTLLEEFQVICRGEIRRIPKLDIAHAVRVRSTGTLQCRDALAKPRAAVRRHAVAK